MNKFDALNKAVHAQCNGHCEHFGDLEKVNKLFEEIRESESFIHAESAVLLAICTLDTQLLSATIAANAIAFYYMGRHEASVEALEAIAGGKE